MRLTNFSSRFLANSINLLFIFSMFLLFLIFSPNAFCSTDNISNESTTNQSNREGAFYAAAIATGLSTIASAIAVGLVGSSAMGAMSERPEMAGRALIFVGLAEGIAIYGLIVSIMILGMV